MANKKPIKKVVQKAIADETYLPKPKILPNKPGVDSGFRAPYEPEQYVNYPFRHYETLPEVVVHSKTKNKYKNLPNVTVNSKKKSPTIKQAVESSAIQMYNPFTGETISTANPGQTKRQIKELTSHIKGDMSSVDALKKVTALTQFVPIPWIKYPSLAINSALGAADAYDANKRGDKVNENINTASLLPWKLMIPGVGGAIAEGVNATADLTDNFGLEQKKNGGWLDEFEKGGKKGAKKTVATTTAPTTTKFVFPSYTPQRAASDNTRVNTPIVVPKNTNKPVPVNLNQRVAKQNEIIKNAKKEKKNYAIIDKAADSIFYFKPTGENITGEPVITGASQNDVDYGLSMKDWFKKTGSSNHEDYFKYLQANKFQTTPAGIFHVGDVRENVATNPDFYGGLFNHWFRPEREKQIYDSRIRDYGPEQKLLTLVSENGVPSSKAIHGTGNPDRINAFNTTGANRAMSNGCVNVNGKTICFDQLGKGSGVFVLPQESQEVLNYNDNVTARNKNKLYAQTRKDVANAFVERGLPISKDAVDFVSTIAEKESKNMRSLGARAEKMFPYFSGGVGAFQIHPDLFKQYLPSDYEVGDFNTGTEAVYNFYNQNKDQSAENMYKKYSGDRKGKYTPVFNRTYNRMKKTYEDGGYVGQAGYTDKGFNYNSAWGGQFQNGGHKGPGPEEPAFQKFFKTLPINLRQDKPDYNIRGYWDALGRPSEFDWSQPKQDDGSFHAFSRNPETGEILKAPFHHTFDMAIDRGNPDYFPIVTPEGKIKTVTGRQYEPIEEVPVNAPLRQGLEFAMGGSLPGSVGFTYARTNSPAPSNGPYAKKTLASADDGIKKKKKAPSTEPVGPIGFLNSYFQSPTFKDRFSGTEKDYKYAMKLFNYRASTNSPIVVEGNDGNGSHTSNEAFNTEKKYPANTSIILSKSQAKGLNADLLNDVYPHEYSHNIRELNPNDELMFAYGDKNPKAKVAYDKWKNLNTNLSFSNWLKTAGPATHDQRPNENYSDLNSLRWLMYKQGIYDTRKGPMTKEHIEKAMKDPYIQKQFTPSRFFQRYTPEMIMTLNNTVAMNDDGEEELTPIAQNGKEMSYYQNGLDWKPKTISKNGSETGPGDPPKKPFTLPPIDLPTSGDSTFLRQKALEQQAWFKKHPEYRKSGSMLTKTYVKDQPGKSLYKVLADSATNVPINKKVAIKKADSDIADIKKALTKSSLSPSERLILQESLKALNATKSKLASEASGYKKQLDKNRFEQRELTTEIINPNVPMGTYDTRIEPQRITVYDNIDSKDPYYDDVVEIPEYDPIALKPRAELTEKELKYRIKNYGTKEDKEFYNAKFVTPNTEKVIERNTFQPKKIEIAKPSMSTKLKTLDVKGVDVPNLNQKSEYAFTWSPDGNKQQTIYYPTYDLWKEAVNKANTGKPGYNPGMVETTESGDKSSGQALLRGTPQFKRGGWLDDL